MNFKTFLIILSIISYTTAQSFDHKCVNDDDCIVLNKQILHWTPATPLTSGFLCIQGQCRLVSGAGKVCSASSECALYQYIQRQLSANISASTFLPSTASSNLSKFLDTICSPEFCTIASPCDYKQDVLTFGELQPSLQLQHNPSNYSCCAAAKIDWQCTQMGGYLTTCGVESVCQPYDGKTQVDGKSELPKKVLNLQYCVDTNSGKSGQWIGIVMVLLGATLLNVGLNVQKMALRKRHEQKRESDRMQILVALQAIREKLVAQRAEAAAVGARARTSSRRSFLGLWGDKNSDANPPPSDDGTSTVVGDTLNRENAGPSSRINSWFSAINKHGHEQGSEVSKTTLNEPSTSTQAMTELVQNTPKQTARGARPSLRIDIGIPFGGTTTNNWTGHSNAPSPTPKVDPDLQSIEFPEAPGDAIQFEKNLGFGRLLVNPIWLFGLTLFVLGNFLNFIALKFAPQSLVAPLGAWALVVNVIIAPALNRESWGWKDIVGVVFIVGGSAIVVLFAGVSGKDYNLCVLLALFGRLATIVFLTVTGVLLVFVYLLLNTIEKNMDLGEEEVSDSEDESEETPDANSESRHDSRRHSEDGRSVKSQNIQNAKEIVRQAFENCHGSHSPMYESEQVFVRPHSVPADSPFSRADSVQQYKHGRHNSDSHAHRPHAKKKKSDKAIELPDPVAENEEVEGGESPSVQNAEEKQSKHTPDPSVDTSLNSLSSIDKDEQQSPTQQSLTRNIPSPYHTHAIITPFVETPIIATVSRRSQNLSGVSGPLADYFGSSGGVAALPTVSRPPSRPMRMRSVAAALRSEHNLPFQPKRTKGQMVKMWFWKMLPKSWRDTIKKIVAWIKLRKYLPTFKKKIPINSPAVQYVLPLSYASLGGLMATITVLFAKSTIHLLSASLFEGDNQYQNGFAWLITLVTVFTAVSQIYWINMGLQRYDALLQIPIFYVVWTVFDVIGGGIYFDEFSNFTPLNYFLFSLGVGVIFVGVGILAMRLKVIHDSDVAETKSNMEMIQMTHEPEAIVEDEEYGLRNRRKDHGLIYDWSNPCNPRNFSGELQNFEFPDKINYIIPRIQVSITSCTLETVLSNIIGAVSSVSTSKWIIEGVYVLLDSNVPSDAFNAVFEWPIFNPYLNRSVKVTVYSSDTGFAIPTNSLGSLLEKSPTLKPSDVKEGVVAYQDLRISGIFPPVEPGDGKPSIIYFVVPTLITIVVGIIVYWTRKRRRRNVDGSNQASGIELRNRARARAPQQKKLPVLSSTDLDHIPCLPYDSLRIRLENSPNSEEPPTKSYSIMKRTLTALSLSQDSESEPCSICLEALKPRDEVRKLPTCEHVFHKECIDNWLLEQSCCCPNCRFDLRIAVGIEILDAGMETVVDIADEAEDLGEDESQAVVIDRVVQVREGSDPVQVESDARTEVALNAREQNVNAGETVNGSAEFSLL
ncbi:hypothetical protein HK098_000668 [Nowakowskiella sp. JEL0407]|nr:hypothetical protein HK098_000668 [Nowakowskiella sp. JEL0407]